MSPLMLKKIASYIIAICMPNKPNWIKWFKKVIYIQNLFRVNLETIICGGRFSRRK